VTFPTLEFSHAEFRSLSGGVVYRGREFPELVGAYVFGDFGTGRIWAAKHDGTRLEWARELVDTPFSVTHVTCRCRRRTDHRRLWHRANRRP
jgi:hypothetical protein